MFFVFLFSRPFYCAVNRFDDVFNRIKALPEDAEECTPHPNPLDCGFKYNFTKSRSQFRTRWYMPSAGADVVEEVVDGVKVQYSGEGCAKVRSRKPGKRQRSGLWLWVCMRHNLVVGWHIMPKPEGLRDAVHSISRFKEHGPKTVFIDFACGCEETSLNWAPGLFGRTQFFHDIFHGMSHKCTSRYMSKRFGKFVPFNTSIMEQVNSALRPLKGMMMGPRTKVRTSHGSESAHH